MVNLTNEPAFRDGICFPLNPANRDNPNYGRVSDEQSSGHWLYSFLRYDPVTKQRFLVAVNLNPQVALKDVHVRIPEAMLHSLGLTIGDQHASIIVKDRLNEAPLVDSILNSGYFRHEGIPISEIPPLSAAYLEIR